MKNSTTARFAVAATGFLLACTALRAGDTDLTPVINGTVRGKYEFQPEDKAGRFQVRNARVSISGDLSRIVSYKAEIDLSDEGQIGRVRINNGADRFDHQAFAHYHVRCACCGRVDDVMIPVLGGVDERAAQASGYQITSHSLQFDGICPACQQGLASTA